MNKEKLPIALFPTEASAEPVLQRLKSRGFAAQVCSAGWVRAIWFVPKCDAGVDVQVPTEQFERAEQFLLDIDASEGALHDAIRCPECGSLRVDYPQFARHSILTNLALGLASELGIIEKNYYCEDCHFTWPRDGSRSSRRRPHQAPYYFIEGAERSNPHQKPASARATGRKAPA